MKVNYVEKLLQNNFLCILCNLRKYVFLLWTCSIPYVQMSTMYWSKERNKSNQNQIFPDLSFLYV